MIEYIILNPDPDYTYIYFANPNSEDTYMRFSLKNNKYCSLVYAHTDSYARISYNKRSLGIKI